MTGFTGAAGDRLDCNGAPDCNGIGLCRSNRELATLRKDNGSTVSGIQYGSVPNTAATWDADRIFGCHCNVLDSTIMEGGFFEYQQASCTELKCPTGDDPVSQRVYNNVTGQLDFQHNEKQKIQCKASSGTFTLTFRDHTTGAIAYNAPPTNDWVHVTTLGTVTFTYFANTFTTTADPTSILANADQLKILLNAKSSATPDYRYATVSNRAWSSPTGTVTMTEYFGGATKSATSSTSDLDDIEIYVYRKSVKSHLEGLATISNVTVTMTDATSGASTDAACHNTNTGVFTEIEFGSEFGDLPLMTSTTSSLSSTTFLVAETQQGTKEDVECSNRGQCNRASGVCACFTGWTNSDGYAGVGARTDCGGIKPYYKASASTTTTT